MLINKCDLEELIVNKTIFFYHADKVKKQSTSQRLQISNRWLRSYLRMNDSPSNIHNPEWGCMFLFLFFLLDQKETKNQGHKIPPAQSDRLTNATHASKTAVILLQFFLSWCGFSNRLPTSVRKPLQTFTLFRIALWPPYALAPKLRYMLIVRRSNF